MKSILKVLVLFLFTNLNAANHIATINLNNNGNGIIVQNQNSQQNNNQNNNNFTTPDPFVDANTWVSFFNNNCGDSPQAPFSDVSDLYNKLSTQVVLCNRDSRFSVTPPVVGLGATHINYLVFSEAFQFENLDVFSSLTSVGTFGVRYDQKNNIDGLGNLSGSVDGFLNLDRSEFTNINALRNVTSIYQLQLSYAQQLTDITGLSSVTTIGRLLQLTFTRLETLNGLESLTTAGAINIGNNQWLTDISALSNVNSVTDNVPRAVLLDDRNYIGKLRSDSYLCNAGFFMLFSANTNTAPVRSNICE